MRVICIGNPGVFAGVTLEAFGQEIEIEVDALKAALLEGAPLVPASSPEAQAFEVSELSGEALADPHAEIARRAKAHAAQLAAGQLAHVCRIERDAELAVERARQAASAALG